MHIGLDVSPLGEGRFLKHRVRGTGFYTKHLKEALIEYFSRNKYTFFTKPSEVSSILDIIHYPYFEPFFLTLPWRYLSKSVVTVHDLTPFVFPNHFPPGLRGSMKWQIQKTILKNMGGIITDSENSKKDIMKFTDIASNKIHVAYLAASDVYRKKTISQAEKARLLKTYNIPTSFGLYVGDVTWNKNLPRLLEAAIKAKIPLVLVGNALVQEDNLENPWNKDLGRVRELIAQHKNVIYNLGFVPTEDLVLLYNIATVFIMPSVYEGFGLPILEAMGTGCPVVTSKEGSLAEIAGEAALYIDPYSVESIAAGMQKVYTSLPTQKKLSQAGIAQAKKFSWEKTAQKTMAAYEAVIKNERKN